MNNELMLYSAPSGIALAPTVADVPTMLEFNRALKPRDAENIKIAVQNGLYEMAAEYIWSRTISILKKDIMQFGNDFVSEMLDRPNGDLDTISEYEIITLSADLGFLNKTARMEFLQFSETIQHYMSNDEEGEVYPSTKLIDMVRSCIQHVLGYSEFEYEVPFIKFRESLKSEIVNQNHPMYLQLVDAPYFYKKTITKTLLNLAKTLSDSAERENVLANISSIVSGVWKDLASDDRWAVGRSYAQANNDGDANLSKALKSLLIKIKGFDYVPENLRSNSYIVVAKELLSIHFGMNNFYNEPACAKTLCDMGSSIPAPAFSQCMTAILACKLGNRYGVSWDAQQYLDALLDRVSTDRWVFYFDNSFSKDEVVLYKLISSQDIMKRFVELVKKYRLNELSYSNLTTKKCIQNASNDSLSSVRANCEELYNSLTSK